MDLARRVGAAPANRLRQGVEGSDSCPDRNVISPCEIIRDKCSSDITARNSEGKSGLFARFFTKVLVEVSAASLPLPSINCAGTLV